MNRENIVMDREAKRPKNPDTRSQTGCPFHAPTRTCGMDAYTSTCTMTTQPQAKSANNIRKKLHEGY